MFVGCACLSPKRESVDIFSGKSPVETSWKLHAACLPHSFANNLCFFLSSNKMQCIASYVQREKRAQVNSSQHRIAFCCMFRVRSSVLSPCMKPVWAIKTGSPITSTLTYRTREHFLHLYCSSLISRHKKKMSTESENSAILCQMVSGGVVKQKRFILLIFFNNSRRHTWRQ